MRQIIATIFLLCMCILPASSQSVTTRSADNQRSGIYQETGITVASLKVTGVRKLPTIPVVGDARGMEAQPLIQAGVKIADGSTHDVMILPSMANVVRGVDAATGAGLWQTYLNVNGQAILGSGAIDMHLINQHWGVLSTGVINTDTGLAYLVDWESPDATPQRGVHYIYTLNVATGAIVGKPVSLAGLKNGNVGYSDAMRKQRSSLVLTKVANQHPMVFFAYGTVLETGRGAAGAIVAYDTVLNKVTAFLPMSQGLGAGIWMGGQGLNADDQGNLYGVTGNGSFNGVNDFGETIFKVTYTPATTTLKVSTWFSPYSDAGRVGLDPTKSGPAAPVTDKPAGVSAPSEEAAMPVGGSMKMPMSTRTVLSRDAATGKVTPLVYPTNPSDPAWSDEDLGSGGCAFVPAYAKLACGGKDGLLYVVNTGNMGNTLPPDFANMKANCAKLATPPVWFTASPGPVDSCPQDTRTLNFFPYGKSRHFHGTPVQYWSPTQGLMLFGWGENSTLYLWKMAATGKLTYVAESREVASIGSTGGTGGMPGGFCSLSSNYNRLGTSILWCSIPIGDANATITQGRLIAYDAENYSNDGDGKHLIKLWDSQDWGIQYVFNKFMPPVIFKSKIYLPNYNGGVEVFGN